jgi:hypothetical protein
MKRLVFLAALLSLALALASSAQTAGKDVKLTAEELIAKHVASIGTPAAINAAKSRVFVGTAGLSAGAGATGFLKGAAQFASTDDMFLMAMVFNSNDYPYEKLAFDGKDLSTGRANGRNTILGDFVRAQPAVVKQGLFGGVLSTSWPLLALEKREKLESVSLITKDGARLYRSKYSSPSNGQLSITLYFDAQTFRHVSTEYKYDTPPPQGAEIVTRNENPTYYTLTEVFSDFKTVGGLTLPTSHRLDCTVNAPTQTISLRWSATYSEVYLNETLDKPLFKVS